MDFKREQIVDGMYRHSNMVYQICEPLFKELNINHFYFIELRESGDFLLLDSCADLYLDYIQTDVIYEIPYQIIHSYPYPGLHLININKILEQLNTQNFGFYNKYNFNHSIRLVDSINVAGEQHLRVFCFDAAISAIENPNYLLQYINELTVFKDYFLDRYLKKVQRLERLHIDERTKADLKKWFQNSLEVFARRKEFALVLNTKLITKTTLAKSSQLTDKEFEVMQLSLQGLASKEIADNLNISKRTVDRHFENLRDKFSCSNRSELIARLQELRIL